MIDSTDHLSGKTGLTVTVNISKNAAAFGAAAGAVTEIGSGWYNVALTTADTGTLGDLAFHCTATGADSTDWLDEVSAAITDDLSKPGTAQTITANQSVNVAQWNGSNVAAPNVAGVPKVDVVDWLGSAPNALVSGRVDGSVGAMASSVLNRAALAADTGLQTVRSNTAQAGAASTITLDASASATDSIYNGQTVYITGGTGVGQSRVITGYVGSTKVATVDRAWQTNPDNTSTFAVLATDGAKTNSSLEVVSASVTGAVGSVTGAVGSVTARVTANTDQWAGGTIPAPNVTGVPLIDLKYTLGTISPAAAGSVRADSVTNAVTVGTNNDKTGYALSSAGVQAIWDALTSALTTVGSIGKLLVTNIDAAISSRSTYAGGDTSGTTTLLSRLTAGRATNLDNLDTTVSSRSTYAGGAVASVTAPVTVSDATTEVDGNSIPGSLRLIAAAVAGPSSGVDTGSPVFKGVNNAKARVSGTASAGNRSGMTYDSTP